MNKLFFLLATCLIVAGNSAAQSAAGSGVTFDPQMTIIGFDHSQRATQTGLAQEQDIRERDEVTYAHGEKPLWEFTTLAPEESLGDIARTFKQERATGKKAVMSWSN
jgi:hypothetical protein